MEPESEPPAAEEEEGEQDWYWEYRRGGRRWRWFWRGWGWWEVWTAVEGGEWTPVAGRVCRLSKIQGSGNM